MLNGTIELNENGIPNLESRRIRFRPWSQAFKDYAFDRRAFDADEVPQQIDAAERFGSDGWMLWNPHNTYSEAGLRPQ